MFTKQTDRKETNKLITLYLPPSLSPSLALPSSHCTPSSFSLSLKLPENATTLAQENGFEIKGYRFTARPEQLRQPRVVRVGAIQNSIALPTTAPIEKQREGIWNKLKVMIKAAAQAGCNIVCTQEAWSKCTP